MCCKLSEKPWLENGIAIRDWLAGWSNGTGFMGGGGGAAEFSVLRLPKDFLRFWPVRCSLRIFRFLASSFQFSSGFSVLLSNVVCIRFSVSTEFFGSFAVLDDFFSSVLRFLIYPNVPLLQVTTLLEVR